MRIIPVGIVPCERGFSAPNRKKDHLHLIDEPINNLMLTEMKRPLVCFAIATISETVPVTFSGREKRGGKVP